MLNRKITHQLLVRLPDGKTLAAGVRPIHAPGLADRCAELLARLLATGDADLEFVAAPRFAWSVLDALQAAGVDRAGCVVEVRRQSASRAGKRTRTVARLKVREYAKPAAATVPA